MFRFWIVLPGGGTFWQNTIILNEMNWSNTSILEGSDIMIVWVWFLHVSCLSDYPLAHVGSTTFTYLTMPPKDLSCLGIYYIQYIYCFLMFSLQTFGMTSPHSHFSTTVIRQSTLTQEWCVHMRPLQLELHSKLYFIQLQICFSLIYRVYNYANSFRQKNRSNHWPLVLIKKTP